MRLADFCTSFVVLVMLEMATSFHQWESDPMFSVLLWDSLIHVIIFIYENMYKIF